MFDATKIIIPSDYTFLVGILLEASDLCIKKTSYHLTSFDIKECDRSQKMGKGS